MDERIGFELYQSCGGVLDVSLCSDCGGVGCVGGEWVVDLTRVWKGGVMYV